MFCGIMQHLYQKGIQWQQQTDTRELQNVLAAEIMGWYLLLKDIKDIVVGGTAFALNVH